MRQGVIAVALVCALAGAAHADDKALARESYSAGKRHYDLGEYPEALAAFKRAYLNYEEPVFLFNIALCYRQLGDRAAAIRSYKAFLGNWPKAPNRAAVERSIAQLEAEEAAAATASPTAGPAPAKVPVAASPPAAAHPAPAVTVASAAPAPSRSPDKGAEPELRAPTGKQEPPRAPSPPPTASAPPPATVPAPATASAPPPRSSHAQMTEMEEIAPNFDRPSNKPTRVKPWVWVLVGMGVAGALAGVVTAAVLTQSKTSDFHPSLPDFNAAALQRAPAPAPALVQVRF